MLMLFVHWHFGSVGDECAQWKFFCLSIPLSVSGSHSRMATGEPTPEALKRLVTILSVVEWATVPEALAQAFYGAIGATGEEHPRVLGVASCEEMDEGMKGLQVDDKPLTIVQKGLIRTVHRVSCLISGRSS